MEHLVDEEIQGLIENDSVSRIEPIHVIDIELPSGVGKSGYKKF